MAGKIYVSSSQDNGETFKDALLVPIADPCECCASRALFSGNSVLSIAYREKANNMRDMYLLRKEIAEPTFTRQKISSIPWEITGCPMTGTFLASAKSDQVMAWETKGQISYGRLNSSDSLASAKEIKQRPKANGPSHSPHRTAPSSSVGKTAPTSFGNSATRLISPLAKSNPSPAATPTATPASSLPMANFC